MSQLLDGLEENSEKEKDDKTKNRGSSNDSKMLKPLDSGTEA